MDPYIGEIRMFAGNYPPEGWAFCNGQLLPIVGNEELFSLLQTTYGGDGQKEFALPDLRGRIALGQGRNPATGTTYPLGQRGGLEKVSLAVSQLPSHTHPVGVSNAEGNLDSPANAVWAKRNKQYAPVPNGKMSPDAITKTGGGIPHDNMMPFITLSFIIALRGQYPPRNE